MDIQVGDRVTYKDLDRNEIYTQMINYTGMGKDLMNTKYYEIIKIERPVYYDVVEEKKELLTDEEKQFLKDICKYYDVTEIKFNNVEVRIIKDGYLLNCSDYPDNMKFENVERGKRYTLEELGLEEK